MQGQGVYERLRVPRTQSRLVTSIEVTNPGADLAKELHPQPTSSGAPPSSSLGQLRFHVRLLPKWNHRFNKFERSCWALAALLVPESQRSNEPRAAATNCARTSGRDNAAASVCLRVAAAAR